MNFGQAISNGFSNYVTFSGRSSRTEYWYWCLFLLIGGVCALVADGLILGDLQNQPINIIFSIATTLPSLAVSVRRLHDVNRSGWWLLIMFTGVGVLLLLYWTVQPSIDESNEENLKDNLRRKNVIEIFNESKNIRISYAIIYLLVIHISFIYPNNLTSIYYIFFRIFEITFITDIIIIFGLSYFYYNKKLFFVLIILHLFSCLINWLIFYEINISPSGLIRLILFIYYDLDPNLLGLILSPFFSQS